MPCLDSENGIFHSLGKRFSDLKVIGGGGSSVVLSGVDTIGNRRGDRVALKRLSLKSRGHCRIALRELRILKNLSHDNIVQTSRVTDSEGKELGDSKWRDVDTVFLVQELLDADLHNVLEQNGSVPEDITKLLMYQLLRGIKYIHSANVVHRDIKPGNLFLNSEDLTLKIGDYGLARIVDPSFDHSGYLTELVTTRYYRAPEVMLQPGSYGFSVDLWSAGCVMAEMLTGNVLFPGCNDLDQLEAIMSAFKTKGNDELLDRLPSHHLQNITDEALDFIQLLLKINPNERLTAEEALSHPYFSSLSDVDDEPICLNPFRVEHEIDDLSRSLLKKLIWSDSCSYPFNNKKSINNVFDGFDESFTINENEYTIPTLNAFTPIISTSDELSFSSLDSLTHRDDDSSNTDSVASILEHFDNDSNDVITENPLRDPGCPDNIDNCSLGNDIVLSISDNCLYPSDEDSSHHNDSLFPRYSPILQRPNHLNCNRELLLLDKRLAQWEKYQNSGSFHVTPESIVGKLQGMCLDKGIVETSKHMDSNKLNSDEFLNSSISHWDQLRVWI